MSLKYTCPSCGTPLGYEGLCWKCKCEQERQAALAWMPEQIVEKQRNLIQNIQRLADMEDPEFADFWQLLGYHDAITPEIQRVALAAEVFWPCELYYHAPADVRDGLIHALLSAEYSSAASNLMSCLAMQGDDKAMETLLELERNPRPWRKGLYVDPSSYAQIGGWTFDKEGQKIQLNFDTCYPMVKGTTGEKSPVRIGRAREDTCPHCGGRMVDMLVLDGRDERLKFLGLDGILTATCCPSCVGFLKGPAFNSFTLDGGVEVFPSELFDGAEKTDCYVSPEDYKALTENPFVLGEAPVPLFYGAACQDVNTVGGFANWVQDAEYTTCPHCGGRMVDILVLDGRDERLRFLGLDGILTATCCPSCVGFLKGPAFNRFALDGGVEVFPSELFDGAEKTDCYVSPEEYKALTENPFVLGEAPVSLFYGAACQDVNTIGGFANWVQDAEYTTCPHCGKPMKYLAQIQWDTVFDCAEGTLYVEFCPDCQIISMQHQQT